MNFSELMARRGTPSYAAFLGRISAGKKSMRSKFDIRRSYRSVSCGALDQRPRRPGEKGLVPRTGVRGGGGLAVTPDVPSAHARSPARTMEKLDFRRLGVLRRNDRSRGMNARVAPSHVRELATPHYGKSRPPCQVFFSSERPRTKGAAAAELGHIKRHYQHEWLSGSRDRDLLSLCAATKYLREDFEAAP